EFTGAMPEAQVRAWIAELLTIAGKPAPASTDGGTGGTAGTAGAGGPVESVEAEIPVPPGLALADDALSRGDIAGAQAAYQTYLNEHPADLAAKQGLAMTRLLERASSYDDAALASDGDDGIDVNLARADVELLDGRVDEAFARLIALVRRTEGDERDRVRAHLVELFDVVPAEDPRLATARRSLANALF
ncbi:MAG: putative thioredoxin, partial [Frankiaceae bacterium]|nr:putative thioredoxin [Frankiaceae bacterium]